MTELTSGPGNEGVVSTVVLGDPMAVSLPPCEIHNILGLTVETDTPAGADCTSCTLRYRDGLQGTGDPVKNEIQVQGESESPVFREREIETRPCSTRIEIAAAEDLCVLVKLSNDFPIRGGELGIAYDPDRVVASSIEPGAGFPGAAENVFADLDAQTNCAEEEGVEGGLVVGWVNEGTGALLPVGDYDLFKICFAPADTPQGGLCSALRFVDCLGVPGAPAGNEAIDEANNPVSLETTDGEVCGGAVPFVRGDPTDDGRFDLRDPLFLLGCLFQGAECPACPDAGDADDSGSVNLADAIYLLNWRFTGGAPPPEPFGSCGADRTADGLGECVFRACAGS